MGESSGTSIWLSDCKLLKYQPNQQDTARASLMIQAFYIADDQDRFILSQNDALE